MSPVKKDNGGKKANKRLSGNGKARVRRSCRRDTKHGSIPPKVKNEIVRPGRPDAAEGHDRSPVFDAHWYVSRYPDVAETGLNPLAHYVSVGAARGYDPSPLFDTDWYLTRYPDVAQAGVSPLEHYLSWGAAEGRDPFPLFDTDWYVSRYLDVAETGLNPLAHFISAGATEGHDPFPLFDTGWYVSRYPDVAETGFNPLVHYVSLGAAMGYDPSPLFDTDWYVSRYPDVAETGLNPLVHYVSVGVARGYDPSPLFDTDWYLARNPDVMESGLNPLAHFISSGAPEGRNPSPLFDSDWYVSRYPDVAETGLNPLVHFVSLGAARGYDPSPLFDSDWYVSRYPNVAETGLNPLVHYVSVGVARGYDPSPLFDTDWYLARNPDVAEKGLNPLAHFISSGAAEGRDPFLLFDTDWYVFRYPDVAETGLNPLVHYVSVGAARGYDPSPLFDTDWYVSRYPDVAETGLNPLVHYVSVGVARGYDPSPLFDSDWYVSRYPDVAETGLNPLVHYVSVGVARGYDPSPLFDTDWYLARNPDVAESGLNPLAHFISSGAAENREPRPADRLTPECRVLDIPYEIWRSPSSLAGRDVCLFATYSANGHIHDHVLTALGALKAEGLAVVLIVATEGLDQPLPAAADYVDGILVRTNHGWDFAAWAAGLAVFPDIWAANSLILLNDSVYGPLRSRGLMQVIEAVRSSKHHVVALTDSYQVRYHLMSYFTGVTRSGLASPVIREFWNGVRSICDKQKVINTYELTSAERYTSGGLTFEVLFPTSNDRPQPVNPTLASWRDLVARGFPFLKVQLLRDKLPQCDPSGWKECLRDNPSLREQIEVHLAEVSSRETRKQPVHRPIPAPRRRYNYDFGLKTYYGATPSCRPSEATDLALEVPFRFQPSEPVKLSPVAVIAHIFYPETSKNLLEKIVNIPVRADLFISTDTSAKKLAIEQAFDDYANGSVKVELVPNIGRDIAPMLVAFASVFEHYDIFLHIHSKRSPHDGRFARWCDFLLDNLLGSPAIVRSILCLLAATDAGIVFSQHFPPVRNLLNFGYDYEMMRGLLARAGISLSKDLVLEFPSGSFFWGRSEAIKPLLDLRFAWSHFPPETGQVDGTLAHAIERSILYCAEAAGWRWAKVATVCNVQPETLVPVHSREAMDEALLRVHLPLLGNRLRPLEEAQFVDEVKPIGVRRDRSVRPRLNVIVPTLQPMLIFGGMTTALGIFGELEEKLGDAFDYRIVSVSTPVDLASMLAFPDYRLLSLRSVRDDLPRTVIDASEHTSGELPVRCNDVFMATAWWTAVNALSFRQAQESLHGRAQPWIYLIQDHEPDFYGWSSHYGLAKETYDHPRGTISIINSEELANYMTGHYALGEAYVLPFAINRSIGNTFVPLPRERIILIYGRQQVRRNAFGILCAGIAQWQQAEPTVAADWRVISAGEDFNPQSARHVKNLEVAGKLPLKQYAEMLGRASIGISLMLSPHPSYPPLEMAYAGMRTITNNFEGKDLSRRSSHIISLPHVTPDAIAAALSGAVAEAEKHIGTVTGRGEISSLPSPLPIYDATHLARRLKRIVEIPPTKKKMARGRNRSKPQSRPVL